MTHRACDTKITTNFTTRQQEINVKSQIKSSTCKRRKIKIQKMKNHHSGAPPGKSFR